MKEPTSIIEITKKIKVRGMNNSNSNLLPNIIIATSFAIIATVIIYSYQQKISNRLED